MNPLIALLKEAGITVNGNQPGDIKVLNEKLYSRVLAHGSIGLGESYMDGWWECNRLDIFFDKLLSANIREKINTKLVFRYLVSKVFNIQGKYHNKNIAKHYNTGNDFFKDMLDPHMQYSCGYWKNAKTLAQAQEAKLKLICEKLELKKGMTLLDIGCGWGGLLEYAAKNYGVTGVGITISEEQAKLARERCKKLPVQILLQDYRELEGTYDRIVSVGMFEHVGHKNYSTFMKTASRLLKDDGVFLLHTIGGNRSTSKGDGWLNKYIFEGGMLPSLKQLSASTESCFVVEDLHNFGPYYDKTLMAWFESFKKKWSKHSKMGNRFYRMWSYYLLCCAGTFRSRNIQLWQVVLSKKRKKLYQRLS